jgi:hypothetical protein
MILSLFRAMAPRVLCWGLPSLGSLRSCFGGLGLIGLWESSCLRLLGWDGDCTEKACCWWEPKVAELDPFGSTLGVIGLVLVNFVWNQEPVTGWQTVYVYVLLIVGVVVLGAFLYVEAHGFGVSIDAIERHEERHSFCVWLHRCRTGFIRDLGLLLLADA